LQAVADAHQEEQRADDQKFFDQDGNLVLEDKGTLQATRLSVEQF
jgi:hypothetical protein